MQDAELDGAGGGPGVSTVRRRDMGVVVVGQFCSAGAELGVAEGGELASDRRPRAGSRGLAGRAAGGCHARGGRQVLDKPPGKAAAPGPAGPVRRRACGLACPRLSCAGWLSPAGQ